MEAITREEKIMSGENLTPITRKEMFLAKALGRNIKTPQPVTREEKYLSKISGEDVQSITPITRKEMYYAKSLGQNVPNLIPITRQEFFLNTAFSKKWENPILENDNLKITQVYGTIQNYAALQIQ